MIPLAANVDAIMAGVDEADADNIARAIAARPWPSYEERMAVAESILDLLQRGPSHRPAVGRTVDLGTRRRGGFGLARHAIVYSNG